MKYRPASFEDISSSMPFLTISKIRSILTSMPKLKKNPEYIDKNWLTKHLFGKLIEPLTPNIAKKLIGQSVYVIQDDYWARPKEFTLNFDVRNRLKHIHCLKIKSVISDRDGACVILGKSNVIVGFLEKYNEEYAVYDYDNNDRTYDLTHDCPIFIFLKS